MQIYCKYVLPQTLCSFPTGGESPTLVVGVLQNAAKFRPLHNENRIRKLQVLFQNQAYYSKYDLILSHSEHRFTLVEI